MIKVQKKKLSKICFLFFLKKNKSKISHDIKNRSFGSHFRGEKPTDGSPRIGVTDVAIGLVAL
jgi:hypothetical protein